MPGLWRTQASRFQSLSLEICWRPAQGEVSGDFYDVIDLQDGRVAVFLGDAPASGPAAAEIADEVRYRLRRNFRWTDRPNEALRPVDEYLSGRSPEALVTVVCAVLDPVAGRAEVSNAGHLPILVVSGNSATFLNGQSDPPLGVVADRRLTTYSLEREAALFMFTDGLVERRDTSLDSGLAVALSAAQGLTGALAWASELARRTTAELGQPSDDATVVSMTLRRPATVGTAPAPERVVLRLYVDRHDLESDRAERAVTEMARKLAGRVRIEVEVADISESVGSAEVDGVMATPTVVRVLPPPMVRVVGGLRSPSELARTLQLPSWEEGE